MLDIYTTYPLHIQAVGPVEYEEFEIATNDLHGIYLDFAVAISVHEDGVVILDLLPTGVPWQVKVGPDVTGAKRWSPSANEDLAKETLAKCSAYLGGPSILEALRAIVESKCGTSIIVQRIKRPQRPSTALQGTQREKTAQRP